MTSTSTESSPYDNDDTTDDNLDFGRVLQIFLRTWPFIKPLTRHLVYFVVCSALIFLFTTTLGFIIIGLVNNGIIAGKPLGLLHAGIYGLDPAVFVDVEELSADARRQLPWLAMGSTIPLLGVVIITGMLLFQYSIWIFQSINQLMRVRLIDQLQMQSLAYHSQAQTGDAIYRIYQDSAMVTSIIRSIFLDPLMFLGRYLFGLCRRRDFQPLGWLLFLASQLFRHYFSGGTSHHGCGLLSVALANATVGSLRGSKRAWWAYASSKPPATKANGKQHFNANQRKLSRQHSKHASC